MTSLDVGPDDLRKWLQASCAAQGVPVTIRDHAVINHVVTLLGQTDRDTAGVRHSARAIEPSPPVAATRKTRECDANQ